MGGVYWTSTSWSSRHRHHPVIKLYVYQPWRHLAWWEEYALSPSHILPSWWTDLILESYFLGVKRKWTFTISKSAFQPVFYRRSLFLVCPRRFTLRSGWETFSDLIFPLNHPVEPNISDGQFLQRELSSWRCWFSSQWQLWWWPKFIFPSFIGFRSDPLSGLWKFDIWISWYWTLFLPGTLFLLLPGASLQSNGATLYIWIKSQVSKSSPPPSSSIDLDQIMKKVRLLAATLSTTALLLYIAIVTYLPALALEQVAFFAVRRFFAIFLWYNMSWEVELQGDRNRHQHSLHHHLHRLRLLHHSGRLQGGEIMKSGCGT